MNNEQNLTTGSIPKKLISFGLPLLFANLLQSSYSIADLIVVGRFVGENGLVAISNASMISFIINAVCIGLTMGGTVLTAQYKGADDKKQQGETVKALFVIALCASVVVTATGLFLYAPVFQLLHIPEESMQDACAYMNIICWGTIFVFGYNAVCSIIKGFGDSKGPLYFIAAATVMNISLDIIFVGCLGMGIKGTAYATVLSQAVSFIISVIYLKTKSSLSGFKWKQTAFKSEKGIAVIKIGLPTAVQMVVVNISYLIMTGMLNRFGVVIAAASGVGLKVNTFAGMPCWAVGQAVTAMSAQNMGANDYVRVRKTATAGLYLNILITLIVMIMIQIFAGQVIMLFHPSSPETIQVGVSYLRICCGVNSLVYAVMYTYDSFAIGIGHANIAMINAFLDAVIVRIPVSWFLAFICGFNYSGIYIGQAVSPILPAIMGVIFFCCKKWQNKETKKDRL